MGDHFKVDTDQLGRFVESLQQSLKDLDDARSALSHVRADQIGTARLDEACDTFQEKWSWPADISQGIWFAGDDPFGGAALVPGTGELLFMQPRIRELTAEQRENAGPERIRRARRAGIKRAVNIR
jgi:hypothetical protein